MRDGVYTGKPGGPFTYREGKVAAIEELAEREGFDLSECYAYSDSVTDLPMLEAVGHPTVVNPDRGHDSFNKDDAYAWLDQRAGGGRGGARGGGARGGRGGRGAAPEGGATPTPPEQ